MKSTSALRPLLLFLLLQLLIRIITTSAADITWWSVVDFVNILKRVEVKF